MDVTTAQLDDQDVKWVSQFALVNAPSATAALFEAETFALVTGPQSPLHDVPWTIHDCGDAETLTDLFDASSYTEVLSAMSRAQMASIGTTTVRSLAGQLMQLTLLTFGQQSSYMLALLDPTTTLAIAEATPGSSIRTRIECDGTGSITATDGPPGSYASIEMELGLWAENLIAPSDRAEYHLAIQQVLGGEPYVSLQSTGAAQGLHFGVTVVQPDKTVIIDLHDRSHQVAAIDSLKRSQAQFDQLSETLPVGVFVVEGEGRTKFASEKLREMLGPRIATEFGWLESIHPDDQALAAEAFADLPKNRHFNIEIRSKQASGEYAWSRWVGSDVRDEDGLLEYVVGFVEDISEWRELNHQIAHQASFDGLTDLPNRITLVTELRDRLEAQKPPKMTGVLFVDLDGFKLINDTQGHSVGDIVLLEVAQRFRRALRPKDLIGRFGGDEFVVVASDITDEDEAKAIGRRLHDILSTPVLAAGRIINVNASLGIALSGLDASSSEQLIGDADIAMYEAKATGRNRSVVFDATLRARASQRFDMTAGLRHARRRRELRLVYQPIVDLQTDTMVGAEALVRWEHPAMGVVSPTVFIPLAEEIGLIDDVGEWVVEQACADLDRLRGQGVVDNDFTLSVNASAQQFTNVAMLATSSLASLNQYGLKPSNLRFELTESVPLAEIPDAANRIRQLTNYGFGLAIDDFGTGYSSLGYLTMLPFDILKLDLSLTAQLEPGSPALAVVDSLTRMSHEMGFKIVAEGIETEKQQTLLTDAGVQLGQGYYISRPVPLGELIDLLEA
ncbi:EAL domain-containing protein [bacterium]|nr:EAL domain-containing protein [bacterium]MDB9846038.1 EAL domain-containing protein [Acidimicrobiales bacterium]